MPTPELSTWLAVFALIALKFLPYIIAGLLLLIVAIVLLVRVLRGRPSDGADDRFGIKGSMDRGDD